MIFTPNPAFKMSLKGDIIETAAPNMSYRRPSISLTGTMSDGEAEVLVLYCSNDFRSNIRVTKKTKIAVIAHNWDGFIHFDMKLGSTRLCCVCGDFSDSVFCIPWKDGGDDHSWKTNVKYTRKWVDVNAGDTISFNCTYTQQGNRGATLELATVAKDSLSITDNVHAAISARYPISKSHNPNYALS